jgi:hypothetical protein
MYTKDIEVLSEVKIGKRPKVGSSRQIKETSMREEVK